MNRSLFLRVTAPAIAVALLLLGASAIGVWHIHRIQGHLAEVLTGDMASLEAAQSLEMATRRVRFNNVLFLMDPKPGRLAPILDSERQFQEALAMARSSINSPGDELLVQQIADEYGKLISEFQQLRSVAQPGQAAAHLSLLADQHPVNAIADPCRELLRSSKEAMQRAANDARAAAKQGKFAIVLFGILGPIGGLVMGYGVARTLRRSIYRLNVRVQDMAHHLGHDVASLDVSVNGDFQSLDHRMQEVVQQVETVAARLQQQQRDLLRAEQLAAVGQMAAGVAHEVRNPLTGIKILVDATDRADNPRPLSRDDIQMIKRELGRVERTVQGLLDFARLPSPTLERCDISEILIPVFEVVRPRADAQGVVMTMQAPKEPSPIIVDRNQFHTVMVNLLINALEAMPNGGNLDVSWTRLENDAIKLVVADTGVGIPEHLGDKVFSPFTTTKPTGTGLGLSLAARIVEEHHGTISASPRAGGGASFVVTLPGAPQGTSCEDDTDHRR